MHCYRLTDQELSEIEENPRLIAERLKVWRDDIDQQKDQAEKTKAFMRRETERTGEVWVEPLII